MSTWQFDDLERRGERLLDRAHTADERDNARRLLDRIAKFEDIKRRSDAIAGIDSTPRAPSISTHRLDDRSDRSVCNGRSDQPGGARGRNVSLRRGRKADHRSIATAERAAIRAVERRSRTGRVRHADRRASIFARYWAGRSASAASAATCREFRKPHITAMQAEPIDGSDVIMALRDQMRR